MTFLLKRLAVAIISFSVSVGAFSSQTVQKPASSFNKNENWLIKQINKHPEIIAAKENMNAVFSQAKGSKKPLYNPELAAGYEREGDANNFEIGISQTIDWWDKRVEKEQQANLALTMASKQFSYLQQEKMAQALQALIAFKAAKMQAKIAVDQENQLDTLLDLVSKRQHAGDLGQIDAELTYLSLSKVLNNTAQAQVKLQQKQAQVKELLPDWLPESIIYPAEGLVLNHEQVKSTLTTSTIQTQWLQQHPQVLAAKANWQISKSNAQLVLLDGKAEPTFTLKAGKNDQDNLMGLSLSIPLNIRNDYSDQAKAANQFATSAQANYSAVLRKKQFDIQASAATLIAYRKNYQRWAKLMQGRDKRIEKLLQKQWQSGDLTTTAYLLALQQRAEGINAGIELQSQYQLSQINWLLQVGQINAVLTQLSH